MIGETIKCQCNGKDMEYVCDTGKTITGTTTDGIAWGRSEQLHQCSDCKTIKAL